MTPCQALSAKSPKLVGMVPATRGRGIFYLSILHGSDKQTPDSQFRNLPVNDFGESSLDPLTPCLVSYILLSVRTKQAIKPTATKEIPTMRTFTLYTVSYKVNGSHVVAEGSFEKLSSARKLAAGLSTCPHFSEVTVWQGQPGGVRA